MKFRPRFRSLAGGKREVNSSYAAWPWNCVIAPP